ncbi:hypothetical protein WG66_007830 [Moniliophthora roreri]|uniref:Uncharacterized protein n=1 Tax=Moniliophthora roreri TaxID=221103 RepID=A0A0W0FU03_MONRR|nr:hypothetical protein WG66_007830 [Moniliophthora roreri]
MSADYPFESLYSIQGVLLVPFISVGLMLFLLGFYVLLFGMVVYFSCTRQDMANRKLHLGWMTSLFVLSVSSAILGANVTVNEAIFGFQAAVAHDDAPLRLWMTSSVYHIIVQILSGVLYILAKCSSSRYTLEYIDSHSLRARMQLYRYSILWGSTKRALAIPVMALFATNVIGLIGVLMDVIRILRNSTQDTSLSGTILFQAHFIASAVNSFLLSLMIAGRIWWLSQEPRHAMGCQIVRRYKKIVSMVIESGFMYSATLIAHLAIRQSLSSLGFGLDLFLAAALMVGIAPTLIILRTSLGLTESAVPDCQIISTLRFGEPPAGTAGEQSEAHAITVDFQQGTLSGCGYSEAHKLERSDAATI